MRDFTEELLLDKFWDQDTQDVFMGQSAPLIDRCLQVREEVISFSQWISENSINSYLEIGIWTGRLLKLFHRLFNFEKTAACDIGLAKGYGFEIELPEDVQFFEGNSHSPIYENWRAKLGQIDLCFIDTSHVYEDVLRDFQINRQFPHKFIAFHGIVGSPFTGDGVKKFWDELQGNKHEIIHPHSEIGAEMATMGIGIWWE